MKPIIHTNVEERQELSEYEKSAELTSYLPSTLIPSKQDIVPNKKSVTATDQRLPTINNNHRSETERQT